MKVRDSFQMKQPRQKSMRSKSRGTYESALSTNPKKASSRGYSSKRNSILSAHLDISETLNYNILINDISKFRRKCFLLRKNMILNGTTRFFAVFIVGFSVLATCLISLAIIYQKFYSLNSEYFNGAKPVALPHDYSSSIIPLIVLQTILLVLQLYNLICLWTDSGAKRVFVWNRDSLAYIGQQCIIHFMLLLTWIFLRRYI